VTQYERYTKEWRKKNPQKWAAMKKKNYSKSRKNAINGNRLWKAEDVALITAEDRPTDAELSKLIGRSVQAIQVKRAKLAN